MKKILKVGLLGLFLAAIFASSFAFTTPKYEKTKKETAKVDPIYTWFNNSSLSGTPVSTNSVANEVARLNALMDGHTYSTTPTGNNSPFEWGIATPPNPEVIIYRSN